MVRAPTEASFNAMVLASNRPSRAEVRGLDSELTMVMTDHPWSADGDSAVHERCAVHASHTPSYTLHKAAEMEGIREGTVAIWRHESTVTVLCTHTGSDYCYLLLTYTGRGKRLALRHGTSAGKEIA